MKKRTIKATVYLVMVLVDRKTNAFLKDAYMEAPFTFTIDHASEHAKLEELVTDRMIHERLTEFFKKQVALPTLKAQYPTLPDFYIGSGKMFTQQVFFEEVADRK